ncbi:ubiquitin-like protein 4A [Leucoraja erinacea]|uniref:ubiquitin-like protein 4A n=1 Tax=Leucoraja erinaceus TaxID=7782 RepID=UPI002454E611|nr:ubiquitin-like protein 4A [Leucoraja erinacea]
MRLSVKLLHGTECWLEVSEDETVSNVKVLIEQQLKIPQGQQRLLYKGKALSDEHRLPDYGIRPGAKLNLVVKAVDRPSPEGTAQGGRSQAWLQVALIIERHFTPADATKVLEQLQKDYERNLRLLSLDDVERISTRILHPDVADAMELSFME